LLGPEEVMTVEKCANHFIGVHYAEAEYRIKSYDGETLYFCGVCLRDYLLEDVLRFMGCRDRVVIDKIASGPEVRY
jgi:hypothetical protein